MAKPPIKPQVWRPPAAPAMDGVYARDRLSADGRRNDGWLYLGGLVETAVAPVRLPEAAV